MTNYAKEFFDAIEDKRKIYTGIPASWGDLEQWEREAYADALDYVHAYMNNADDETELLRCQLREAKARIADLEAAQKVPA